MNSPSTHKNSRQGSRGQEKQEGQDSWFCCDKGSPHGRNQSAEELGVTLNSSWTSFQNQRAKLASLHGIRCTQWLPYVHLICFKLRHLREAVQYLTYKHWSVSIPLISSPIEYFLLLLPLHSSSPSYLPPLPLSLSPFCLGCKRQLDTVLTKTMSTLKSKPWRLNCIEVKNQIYSRLLTLFHFPLVTNGLEEKLYLDSTRVTIMETRP